MYNVAKVQKMLRGSKKSYQLLIFNHLH